MDSLYDTYVMSDCERDEISSKLSDDIIITNIREQLASPILIGYIENNILSYFNERFSYITKLYASDDTLINNCKEIRKQIYTEICNKIIERYSITTSLLDNTDSDDFYFYVTEMYDFFVMNYKSNLINFFKYYIFNTKKELIKNYKVDSDKKDLSFKSLKKTFNNSDYIHIIYNLENIISDFISMNESDFETVFNTLIDSDPYEITLHTMGELVLDNKFDTYINGPLFLKEFFKPLLNNETKDELLAQIRIDVISMLVSNGNN